MVLASIHQPSYSTLNEFTSLLLLSRGTVCYFGKVQALGPFLTEIGAEPLPFVGTIVLKGLVLVADLLPPVSTHRYCAPTPEHGLWRE